MIDTQNPFKPKVEVPSDARLFTPKGPEAPEARFGEAASAMFMDGTIIGAGVDYARQFSQRGSDETFNPYSYGKSLPEGRRRDLFFKYAPQGAFDPDRFGAGSSPEEVEAVLDQIERELDRDRAVAQAGVGETILGVGLSMVDLSTLIPMVGYAKGAKSVLRAGTILGANALATEAVVEGALQTAQTTRTAAESFMNIGIAGATGGLLGAGIGVFSKLRTDTKLAQRVSDELDPAKPDPFMADSSAGAMEVDPAVVRQNAQAVRVGDDYSGQWIDSIGLLDSPQTVMYKAGNKGLEFVANTLHKMGAVGPFAGHREGQVSVRTVEDRTADWVRGQQAAYEDHILAFDSWRTENGIRWRDAGQARQEFDRHVMNAFENPEYTTGNAKLDAAVHQSAKRFKEEVFHPAFEKGSELNVFGRDKIADLRDARKTLEDELAEFDKFQQDPSSSRITKLDEILSKIDTDLSEIDATVKAPEKISTAKIREYETAIERDRKYLSELDENLARPVVKSARTDRLKDVPTDAPVITKPFKQRRSIEGSSWVGEIDGNEFVIYRDTDQFGYAVWHLDDDSWKHIGGKTPGQYEGPLGFDRKAAIDTLMRRVEENRPKGGESKIAAAERARLERMRDGIETRIKETEGKIPGAREERLSELVSQRERLVKSREDRLKELTDTKKIAVERAKRKLSTLDRRVKRLEKYLSDAANYVTHAWNGATIRERDVDFENLLIEDFARRGDVSFEQVKMARAELEAEGTIAKLDEDELAELEEEFEEFGIETLDPEIRDRVLTKREAYARREAREVVEGFAKRDSAYLTRLGDEDITSSRVRGRRLHLHPDTIDAMYREGFLHSDVGRVTRAYANDMGARISMKEVLGVGDMDEFNETVRVQALRELKDAVADGRLTDAERAKWQMILLGEGETNRGVFQQYLDRLLGRDVMLDENNLGWLMTQGRKFTTLLRMGGSTISAVTDLATMSYVAGMRKAPEVMAQHVKYLASLNDMLEQVPDKHLRQMLVGIENYLVGAASDHRMTDIGNNLSLRQGVGTGRMREVTGRVEQGLDFAVDKMFQLNLMTRWNRSAKAASGTIFLQKVLDYGKGVSKMSEAEIENFARYGMTPKDLEWLASQPIFKLRNGTEFPDTLSMAKTVKGREMRDKLFTAMKLASEEAVVTMRKGDTPAWLDKQVGKTFFQFQGFALAWSHRFARRALKGGILPRDLEAAFATTLAIGLGGMAFAIREKLKGRELPDPTNAEGMWTWMRNSVDRSGMTSVAAPYLSVVEMLGGAAGIPGIQAPSRFAEKNAIGLTAGPVSGVVTDAGSLLFNAAKGEWADAGRKALRLTPYNNVWYFDAVMRRTVLE